MSVLTFRSVLGIVLIIVLVVGTIVGGSFALVADRVAFTLTLVSVFRDLRVL